MTGFHVTDFEIRLLGPRDAAAYQALRLRALREAPEAFGSTYSEEMDRALGVVAERLAPADDGGRITLGALVRGDAGTPVLVGVVSCVRQTRPKTRHKAAVYGMYVAPEARRRGVGRGLIERVVAATREWPGVERLTLSVVERGTAARALYRAVGFRAFGLEPDAFRSDGVSDAVEHMSLDLSEPDR